MTNKRVSLRTVSLLTWSQNAATCLVLDFVDVSGDWRKQLFPANAKCLYINSNIQRRKFISELLWNELHKFRSMLNIKFAMRNSLAMKIMF